MAQTAADPPVVAAKFRRRHRAMGDGDGGDGQAGRHAG